MMWVRGLIAECYHATRGPLDNQRALNLPTDDWTREPDQESRRSRVATHLGATFKPTSQRLQSAQTLLSSPGTAPGLTSASAKAPRAEHGRNERDTMATIVRTF